MENERLRMELMKLTGNKTGSTSSSKPDTPSQHMMMGSDHDHSGEPLRRRIPRRTLLSTV